MRMVELVNGIQSSALGFGCGSILGSVDARTSRRALEAAFHNGINHFDLARSYGYGEAESFVGKVLRDKRKSVVIASKFGIAANWKAALFRSVKPVVRQLRNMKRNRGLDEATRLAQNNIAQLFHDRIEISTLTMRKSLEVTLRSLKTDYIDFFLVHEPQGRLGNVEELSEAAERLKEEGKIRAWGLAYMKDQRPLHEDYLSRFDVLQFNNSPVHYDYKRIREERNKQANIFFSPFKGGGEISHSKKLRALFNDFPNSVILCSMFTESHLIENVQLASL